MSRDFPPPLVASVFWVVARELWAVAMVFWAVARVLLVVTRVFWAVVREFWEAGRVHAPKHMYGYVSVHVCVHCLDLSKQLTMINTLMYNIGNLSKHCGKRCSL